ncbi:hypothetical protein CIB48_g10572 [Xylaria polymorpha]|nr:hypothetical protein CIB48_g10572 [Xylaria polymorpha]
MDSRSNNGDSQNGSQSGNITRKRHRSPTMDTDNNHSERSSARRHGFNQGDMAQISMTSQVQNMNAQIIERARNAPRGTRWVVGELRPNMFASFRPSLGDGVTRLQNPVTYPRPNQGLPWGQPPVLGRQNGNINPATGQVTPPVT